MLTLNYPHTVTATYQIKVAVLFKIKIYIEIEKAKRVLKVWKTLTQSAVGVKK